MYAENSSIFVEILFVLAIFLSLYFVFYLVMKKLLKVERNIFSNAYVNTKHKKVDRVIRISVIGAMAIGFIMDVSQSAMRIDWFLKPWFWLLILVVVTEVVKAIMEWKYVENRNVYKFTVYQLVFIIITLLLVYITNVFGRL